MFFEIAIVEICALRTESQATPNVNYITNLKYNKHDEHQKLKHNIIVYILLNNTESLILVAWLRCGCSNKDREFN